MVISKDGRTTSDRKYRPIRREQSRYGKLEKALNELKDEGFTQVASYEIANRVGSLGMHSIRRFLMFTKGIQKLPGRNGEYVFTDEEIRVDAG